MSLDDLSDHLKALRAKIDDADQTELGKLPKLLDGMMADCDAAMRIVDALPDQRAVLEKAERALAALLSFRGQNLQVHGWHQNGNSEPLDSFIDSNTDGTELTAIRAALAAARGES